MALHMNIVTPHGIEVANAYHRVEGVELLSKSQMAFSVRAYADVLRAAVSDARYAIPYDLDGENPIRQAYLHLKSLPEFAGATDC
jgi:hypothetical protein